MQIFLVEIFTRELWKRIPLAKWHIPCNKTQPCDALLSSPFHVREASPFSPPSFEPKASKNRPGSLFIKTLRVDSHPFGSFLITGKKQSLIHLRKSIPASIRNWR